MIKGCQRKQVEVRTGVESQARVVARGLYLDSGCAHGFCLGECSHLMWECKACSTEGGWGAPREMLERIVAEHVCMTPSAKEGGGKAMKAIYKNLQIERDPSASAKRKAFVVEALGEDPPLIGYISYSAADEMFVFEIIGEINQDYKGVQLLAEEIEDVSSFMLALEALRMLGVNPLEVEK